jgi:hypothetical protein
VEAVSKQVEVKQAGVKVGAKTQVKMEAKTQVRMERVESQTTVQEAAEEKRQRQWAPSAE